MSVSPDYPSGNVTFVFTDIEGSSSVTRRLEERGPPLYESHLRDPHRERLRELVQQHGGFEVQRAGDGHMFVFALADDALACVVAFQQSLAAQPISLAVEGHTWTVRVRIGVHTAERQRQPQRMENGRLEYPGSDTNYAARIGALGAGGQILISEHTRRAAPGIGNYRLHPWPNRYLKSFDEAPQTVYELLYQPGQAPREPGSRFFPEFYEGERNRYIPREEKEAEVLAHFTDRRREGSAARLVTIKAEGGMGKTRLAVACAVKLVGAFEDDVHFVGLAPVAPTVEAVAEAIGRALRLPPEASRPEELLQTLRTWNTLLLLDNYESVQGEAVGQYVARLVTETGGVSLLATGRKAVGVADVEQLVSLEEGMTASEARALFVARARLKGRLTGALSPAEAAQLARIVALTEQIPLALELAAAWTEYLELREIAEGIEQTPLGEETALPPDGLRAEDRVTFERHRSLERSLDWSYQLLDEREGRKAQAVFAACSLFAGPFDAATAATVAGERAAKLDLIRLQNASLVRRVAADGTTRYRLHRFTREYGARRLAELPSGPDLRRRFVDHYLGLIRQKLDQLSQLDSLAVLDAEWRSVMAAAEAAAMMQDRRAIIGFLDLDRFLDLRGLWADQERLCRRALTAGEEMSDRPLIAVALRKLGFVSTRLGRLEEAVTACERALALSRESQDPGEEGKAHRMLGKAYYTQDRWEEATAAFQRSLAICRQLQDQSEEAKTLCDLGLALFSRGHWEEAITTFQEGLALCRRLHDRIEAGSLLNNLGLVSVPLGRLEEAVAAFQQSLAIQQELQFRSNEAMVLSNLGATYQRQGRWEEAAAAFQQSLAIQRESGYRLGEARALGNLGALYADQGRSEEAVKVLEPALALCRHHHYRQLEGVMLANLGIVYRQQSRWEAAVAAFEQALATFREFQDHVHEAEVLQEMALLWEARADVAQALPLARQAVAVLEGTQAAAALAKARELLARLEAAAQ